MKLRCYSVKCKASDGTVYDVGVMVSDQDAAKRAAENSLLEGRHIRAKAISVEETDRI